MTCKQTSETRICFYFCNSSVNTGFQQKSVLAFRFIFIIDFYKTKVPLLQTNLIFLERILVVSEIVTKPNTWYIKTFKHLSHFLYLMRPIFVIISSCDKTESHKKKLQHLLRTHSTSKISNNKSTVKKVKSANQIKQ